MYWGLAGDCRYSGARRGIGGSWGGVLGPLGGIRGCQGVLGWQVDWEPDHIGP